MGSQKVLVDSIPLDVSEEELRDYFEGFGPVLECQLIVDPASA